MSDLLLLKADHVKPLLRKLARQYRLVAPIRTPQGDTIFAEVDDLESAFIDLAHQPQNSLKSFLFPQQEALADYRLEASGSYRFTPIADEPPPTLYFGVRPCDLNAVLYLDVALLPGRRDSAYLRRRQNSLLVGLNCNQPFADCFCHAMKAGPFLEAGADLQLTDLGDRFLVEVGRAKGEELLQQWALFFSPAPEEEANRRFQLFLEARDGFSRQVHAEQAIKRLAAGEVPEAVWEEMAHRCQDCGGCAYLCPTCTCFSIIDRPLDATSGQRLRVWDACTFAGFSGMAGGHTPVGPGQTLKQRFMHKLAHDVKKHGRPSCVGCGRCSGACFGGADMLRFLDLAGGEPR